MKIFYNNKSLNAVNVKQTLNNSCYKTYKTNTNSSIVLFQRKGCLFLEITTGNGRVTGTTYKLIVHDDYVRLKYSGILSYMNIFLVTLSVGIPIIIVAFLLIFMIADNDFREATPLITFIPIYVAFLWTFIIRHRIMAKKYIKKILKI